MELPQTETINGSLAVEMWKDGITFVKVFQRLYGSYHRGKIRNLMPSYRRFKNVGLLELRHALDPESIEQLKVSQCLESKTSVFSKSKSQS